MTKYYVKGKEVTKEQYKEHCEQKVNNPVLDIKRQIAELNKQLKATDYKAIKYAEGFYTDEQYASIKAERQAIREQIKTLEKELESLNNK